MGSFLVYTTIIVGAILVFLGYINSNPLQSLLAYRWIGVQCMALVVYALAALTNDRLNWFWVIQSFSIILLTYTVVLMAVAEAAWCSLWRQFFDWLSK